MTFELAKKDTSTIRNALGYKSGRVYSENRSYGRRIKFWYGARPGDMVIVSAKLKETFGDRFIKCGYSYGDFEVQLKRWN